MFGCVELCHELLRMDCDFVTVHFVVFKCDVRARLTRCGVTSHSSKVRGMA